MTACLCRMGQAAPRGFLYTPRGVFVLEHWEMKSHVQMRAIHRRYIPQRNKTTPHSLLTT